MAITFPTTLDSLPNPTGVDLLENATLALDHDQQHSNANDAIEALEAKVGIDSSAVNTSHDYKLSGVATGDKAVSKTGTETLTNKTLTSPVINVTSDATGDIYYRSAGGLFTRLAAGATDTILSIVGGIPSWISNPAATNASTTVKGIVEAATAAQVTAGTATGETGAVLAVTPDALASSTPVFNGSGLTNLPSTMVATNGTTTKNAADASATQTIAHGLGKAPKTVEIFCTLAWTAVTISGSSREVNLYANTFYNGTTQSSQSFYAISDNVAQGATFTLNRANNGDTTVGVVTFDATNISIAWTKTGSPTGTYNILWRAVA